MPWHKNTSCPLVTTDILPFVSLVLLHDPKQVDSHHVFLLILVGVSSDFILVVSRDFVVFPSQSLPNSLKSLISCSLEFDFCSPISLCLAISRIHSPCIIRASWIRNPFSITIRISHSRMQIFLLYRLSNQFLSMQLSMHHYSNIRKTRENSFSSHDSEDTTVCHIHDLREEAIKTSSRSRRVREDLKNESKFSFSIPFCKTTWIKNSLSFKTGEQTIFCLERKSRQIKHRRRVISLTARRGKICLRRIHSILNVDVSLLCNHSNLSIIKLSSHTPRTSTVDFASLDRMFSSWFLAWTSRMSLIWGMNSRLRKASHVISCLLRHSWYGCPEDTK